MAKEEKHFRSVFELLLEYRDNGILCDAVLVTGCRGVRAHSVILAATSPVLKEALEAKVGSSLRYVHLPDYDFATIQVAVRFMYTGRLILNCTDHGEQEQVEELVTSLNSLGLNISNCEVEYESILNQKNNEQKYTVDFFNFDAPKLQFSKLQYKKLLQSCVDEDANDDNCAVVELTCETDAKTAKKLHDSNANDSPNLAADRADDGDNAEDFNPEEEEFANDEAEEGDEQNISKPFLIQSINYLISNEHAGSQANSNVDEQRDVATEEPITEIIEHRFVDDSDQKWKFNTEMGAVNVKAEMTDVLYEIQGDGFVNMAEQAGVEFCMQEVLSLGASDDAIRFDGGDSVYATEIQGYDFRSMISTDNNMINNVVVDDSNCLPRVPFVGGACDDDDKNVLTNIVSEASAIENEDKKNSKPLVVRSYRTFRQPFSCARCELRFSTKLGLKRHEEAHDRRAVADASKIPKNSKLEGYFPCEKCSKLFTSRPLLERHEQSCYSSERIYECRFCGSQFNKRKVFMIHERRHTGERPVLCHLCGRAFAELRLLRAHLKTPHDQYPCSTCSKMFVSRAKLAVHNLTEHGIWLKSRRERKRRRLLPADDPANVYLCDTCGKSFSSSNSLSTHSRIHKRSCQLCEMKLDSEPELIEHMNSFHPGVEYVRRNYCDLCAKELSSEKTYIEHMRLHSNDRPFLCVTCGKTFVARARLVFHLQKVHGSTGALTQAEEEEFNTKITYPCEYCDKVFRWPDARIAHMATHTGLAPYQCKHCNKRFLYKGSLYAHVRIHTGELPYSCHVCGKRFRQATHVKRHMHGHQGTKPYQCQMCGKGYMGRIDLRNHYTRVHHVSVTQTRCNARNSYSFNLPTEMEGGEDVVSSEDVIIEERCARTDGRVLEGVESQLSVFQLESVTN